MRGAGALALLALACSGGSTDAPEPAVFFAQVAAGPGGVVAVDGTPLDVRGATLRLLDDGVVVTVADEVDLASHLRPGMVVSLRGELRGSTAVVDEVVHRGLARGPLAGRGESSLVVGGTETLLGPTTPVLDAAGAPIAPADLPGGTLLTVDGWPEGGARVRASGVRVAAGSPPVRLRGWSVTAPVSGVFQLALFPGGEPVLAVDGNGVVPAPQVPARALVRVEGAGITAGLLAATDLAVEALLTPAPGAPTVVEGVATEVGTAELVLGAQRIQLASGVVFEGVPSGGTPGGALWPGVRLVARGTGTADGLIAERIRFVGVSRLAGRISSFATDVPVNTGSFKLGADVVSLLQHTIITDAAGVRRTIAELLELHGQEPAGLPVVVHGLAERDGTIRAYRVEVTAG